VTRDSDFADSIGIDSEIHDVAVEPFRKLKAAANIGEPVVISMYKARNYFTPEGRFFYDWIYAGRGFDAVDELVRGWSNNKLRCGCNPSSCQFELGAMEKN
jgi:hypothetical protein